MAVDYYPFVTVAKIRAAIIAGWDTDILATLPEFTDYNKNPGQINDGYSAGLRTVPSDETAATYGKSGYRGDVTTLFTIRIKEFAQDNLEKFHYLVRKAINNYQLTNGFWRVTNWAFNYSANNNECLINCIEELASS